MAQRHIAILGNGVTGITAARHIRKRTDDRITVISGETDHHFSRTALMYVFMGDMAFEDTKPYPDAFWRENGIALKRGWVESIDTAGRELRFVGGERLGWDELVLATGSKPNKFGWPGQDLEGVQGLYSFQDLETMERLAPSTRHATIVGGGLIGVEVAEMLLSRGIGVTFLVREENFWNIVLPEGEARLVGREILRHGVDLRLATELAEILPDASGRARAAATKSGEEIPCEMVFLTVGVGPNIAAAKASGIACDRGVLVDRHFRASAPGVWAGGDCAQHREPPPGRRPVEQVWYTGKIHGEHIAANLCGDPRPYTPGIWFNSAKFFDIEYQTYGTILPGAGEGEEDFYWEDGSGERCLRIRFRSGSGAVLGANLFGLRHRHAVWERWIGAGTAVEDAVADLGAANCDPEFSRRHEPDILARFNALFPERAAAPRLGKSLFSPFLRKLFAPAAQGARP